MLDLGLFAALLRDFSSAWQGIGKKFSRSIKFFQSFYLRQWRGYRARSELCIGIIDQIKPSVFRGLNKLKEAKQN